ncbi:glycoprotein-N-acetylgalactosamine 3-beta-galactosyltransferase 1 [Drosophila subpulchrella]|uniref:glycoprotein-N-acetylgalactosamine 3-beta-galactosyltransferase 1 n=1 Tax=Drosophila subpulchrella TaxID=1486046 RepID=UPI0018A1ADC8|nr:glycoprotein-N-acetylgalactosamine 3-beta-galactosyltransferase 1 [Drosophila subpulchrella]
MERKECVFEDRNSHYQQHSASTSSSRPVLFLLLGIGIGYLITQLILWPIIPLNSHTNRTARTTQLDIDLTDEVRVLCYVNTKPSNHKTQAKAVLETWGKRCNKLIFFSSRTDVNLSGSVALAASPNFRESWRKTKGALQYLYDHHLNDADWFLEADDETYVLMENLRYMVYPYSPEMAIYFGSPGTVMSRAALRRFVEVSLPNPSKCEPKDSGPTAGKLKECLDNVNVMAGNTYDSKGRRRMYLIDPQARSNLFHRYDSKFWFWKFLAFKTQKGIFSWSNYAVSFHFVQHRYMHCFEYMIYRLRAFGRKLHVETLPEKYSPSKEENINEEQSTNVEKEVPADYAY